MAAFENDALLGIRRTLRAVALGALGLFCIWLFEYTLLLGFTAVMLACVLRGASDAVHRKTGLAQGWSLFGVILSLLIFFIALIWWRGSHIADQAVQISARLTMQLRLLWKSLGETAWGPWIASRLREETQSLGSDLGGYMTGFASSTLGVVGSVFVVSAAAIFLAISPQLYQRGVLRLLPFSWRRRGKEVLSSLGQTLQRWFVGQLLDMAAVTVLLGAGLFTLGIPLATTLALFAGLLNFVPYVGALAGAIPAVIVALSKSPAMAMWVALLFLSIQTLEGNLIAPLIQKRTVALPPALTILSQTIMATLFGVLGIILATPMVAVALVAVRMIYVESILERGDLHPAIDNESTQADQRHHDGLSVMRN